MEEMNNIEQIAAAKHVDFAINSDRFHKELYSICEQYLQGLSQLRAEPTPISELVYSNMPERPAKKLIKFLEGKNVTTLRYHRLLEIDPQKALLFIDGAATNYDMALMKDSPSRMSYAEFLAQINGAIMRLFRESVEGSTALINDPYKEQAAALEGDELYGVLYRAVKAGDQEALYLSAQSDVWLSYEALMEEYFALDLPVAAEELIYEDGKAVGQRCSSLKPIGYANSDKFTWIAHKDGFSKHKALLDAISQLELSSLTPATFMMLMDMNN
jgi:hypothetical protein